MGELITVFGSYVADLMSRSPSLPKPGETVKGTIFRMGAGGKGFNQGIAACKAGARVAMVSKLGNDTFGQLALDGMSAVGMDTSHLFFSGKEDTGIALILVDENTGQNEIVVVPGACGTITSEEVESRVGIIRESGWLLTQLEINLDALEHAVLLAYQSGVKVILNPAPAGQVSDKLLSMVDIITPNETEAETLTGIRVDCEAAALKAAEVFFSKGVKNVIITLGDKGAFVSDGKKHNLYPPFKVKALDTTGAGDAFNGGLAAALSDGMDVWQATRFANALAALSVTRLGTSSAMPVRSEIDALLSEQSDC